MYIHAILCPFRAVKEFFAAETSKVLTAFQIWLCWILAHGTQFPPRYRYSYISLIIWLFLLHFYTKQWFTLVKGTKSFTVVLNLFQMLDIDRLREVLRSISWMSYQSKTDRFWGWWWWWGKFGKVLESNLWMEVFNMVGKIVAEDRHRTDNKSLHFTPV